MNKKIKQLADEAEKYADANFKGEPFWSEAYESKFARLIVRECIDYCGENLSKTVGGALKIHFGVEE
jgi:hypothetical protein